MTCAQCRAANQEREVREMEMAVRMYAGLQIPPGARSLFAGLAERGLTVADVKREAEWAGLHSVLSVQRILSRLENVVESRLPAATSSAAPTPRRQPQSYAKLATAMNAVTSSCERPAPMSSKSSAAVVGTYQGVRSSRSARALSRSTISGWVSRFMRFLRGGECSALFETAATAGKADADRAAGEGSCALSPAAESRRDGERVSPGPHKPQIAGFDSRPCYQTSDDAWALWVELGGEA